jgi:hypothetical protein
MWFDQFLSHRPAGDRVVIELMEVVHPHDDDEPFLPLEDRDVGQGVAL